DAITPPESAPAVAAPPPAAPPSAARSVPDFVPPPPARLPGSAPAAPGRRPGASPDFDELAFLKSVVDPREAGGQGAPRAAGAGSSSPAPAPSANDFSSLVAGARESAAAFGAASRPASPAG